MKIRLLLIVLAGSLISFSAANAQDDSTHYDLSRVRVNKNFTQNTTIKGSDLEKYNSSNLSDAINVWLNGTYTNSASIIYVVDGITVTDVNAYSIYDVEEVTLVQTALAQASGAAAGQQMVLVKTRRTRKGKQDIEFSGSSSLVNLRNTSINPGTDAASPGAKSSTNVFDEYYLAAYKNFNHADMGITADYQHDVDPSLKAGTFTLFEPSSYKRYKITAFADADLWKGTTLAFSANYVPQANKYSYTVDIPSDTDPAQIDNTFNKDRSSQHMAATNITLNSHIAGGLSNAFVIGYNHYNYLETDSANNFFSSNGFSDRTVTLVRAEDKAHNLLIRDNFFYHTKVGGFDFEPALNFTYRNYSDSVNYRVTTVIDPGTPGEFTDVTNNYLHPHYSVYMLTPSFDLYYKDIINIQGGFTGLLNQGKATTSSQATHLFPFFTFSFDMAKWLGVDISKLRFHFSFARQSDLLADDYATLLGATFLALNPTQTNYSPNVSVERQPRLMTIGHSNPLGPGLSVLNPLPTIANPNNVNITQQYHNIHSGVDLGVTKNFTITYSVEYKEYTSYVEEQGGIVSGGPEFALVPYSGRIVTNRFALLYNYHSEKFTWNATLNGTETELHVNGNDPNATIYNTNGYLNSGHRWSGGFTNRFVYQYYFMGIDFLYQAGEQPYSLIHALQNAPDYIPPTNKNSFALQNFYFGARINIPRLKYAEIYFSGRNILQNAGGDLTDGRRFYGLGFKTGF